MINHVEALEKKTDLSGLSLTCKSNTHYPISVVPGGDAGGQACYTSCLGRLRHLFEFDLKGQSLITPVCTCGREI